MESKTLRRLTNLLIFVMLCLMLIEGLPVWSETHSQWRTRLAPLHQRLGIEQNGWQLYAPEPDYWNLRLSATLTYPEGGVAHWQSPDWSSTPSWRKFLMARRINYYEYIADDVSGIYWPCFADHLRRSLPSANGRLASRVELIRDWAEIPAPIDDAWQPADLEIPFDWDEAFFFAKEYP